MIDYVPQSWMEARIQLHSEAGLTGALLGTNHTIIVAYNRFLRQYDQMITRLESEIGQVHSWHLGPVLVTSHVQLAWLNWLMTQLDPGETGCISTPDFSQGLNTMEAKNHLMWLPMATNVPMLLVLHSPTRAPGRGTVPAVCNLVPDRATVASNAPSRAEEGGGGTPRRDRGPSVLNPKSATHFVGNIQFTHNVRSHSVALAISTAGSPLMAVRSGMTMSLCVCHGTEKGSASSFVKGVRIMAYYQHTSRQLSMHDATSHMREVEAGDNHHQLPLSI
jgi:hypothetical protein